MEREELGIRRLEHGYVVELTKSGEDFYDVEELAYEHPLDVLAEVLRFLGFSGKDADRVIVMLAELGYDEVYVLTDAARERFDQGAREQKRGSRRGVESERPRAAERDRWWEGVG